MKTTLIISVLLQKTFSSHYSFFPPQGKETFATSKQAGVIVT